MDTILVTGGAGFLGSSLAVWIRDAMPRVDVVAFDNLRRRGSELNLPRLRERGVTFVHGDVRSTGDLDALPPADLLLDCSAEPSVLAGYAHSPSYVVGTNLVGAANCLEYARRRRARVIFLSTSRVYPIDALNRARFREGQTRFEWTDDQALPGVSSRGATEDFPLHGPRSIYGATKLAAEMLLDEYRYAYGTGVVVNRCGVLAGPWQMGKIDQGVVAYWVLRHLFQQPLSYIGFGGAGKQLRDLLHVDDLCELVMQQISDFDTFDGQVFNVGGGPELSVSLCELTDLCRDVTGHTMPIGSEPETRPADVRIYVSDCAKLFAKTSWRPARTAHQAVEDTARWMRQHADALKHVLG